MQMDTGALVSSTPSLTEKLDITLYDPDRYNETVMLYRYEPAVTSREGVSRDDASTQTDDTMKSVRTQKEQVKEDLNTEIAQSQTMSEKGDEEIEAITSKIRKVSLKEPIQEDVDLCKRFIEEALVKLPDEQRLSCFIPSTELRDKYMTWLSPQKAHEPLGRNAFYSLLDTLLGKRVKSRYYGVRLK